MDGMMYLNLSFSNWEPPWSSLKPPDPAVIVGFNPVAITLILPWNKLIAISSLSIVLWLGCLLCVRVFDGNCAKLSPFNYCTVMSQDCGHNSEMILFVPDEDARKESCIIWSEDSHPPEVEKSNHHTARQSKGGGYRTFQNKGFCFLVFFFCCC